MNNMDDDQKDHDPMEDGQHMAQQVATAFHMPWPRKPLGKGKGSAGAKGSKTSRPAAKSPAKTRSARGPKHKKADYGFS
jgi:hypothetical protein